MRKVLLVGVLMFSSVLNADVISKAAFTEIMAGTATLSKLCRHEVRVRKTVSRAHCMGFSDILTVPEGQVLYGLYSGYGLYNSRVINGYRYEIVQNLKYISK